MTAVKKEHQKSSRSKRGSRAGRRIKSARKHHKRIHFHRTDDGPPGTPGDKTS